MERYEYKLNICVILASLWTHNQTNVNHACTNSNNNKNKNKTTVTKVNWPQFKTLQIRYHLFRYTVSFIFSFFFLQKKLRLNTTITNILKTTETGANPALFSFRRSQNCRFCIIFLHVHKLTVLTQGHLLISSWLLLCRIRTELYLEEQEEMERQKEKVQRTPFKSRLVL